MNHLPNLNLKSTWVHFNPPFTVRNIKVGPYMVRVSPKTNYRLYSVAVGSVTVLKLASIPAIHNIVDAISRAISQASPELDLKLAQRMYAEGKHLISAEYDEMRKQKL